MDFITKLPRSSGGYDTIWVIVDRLTKSAYFLVIREDYKMRRLARLYIDEIVARHGVHVSIISYRRGRFTSRFCVVWRAKIREIQSIRPELVQETTNKVILIKEKLKRLEIAKRAMLAIGEYWTDVNMHVPLEEIKVYKTLHFVEEPVEIIDREVKSLKRSSISIVKVCWDSKRGHEDFMRTNYSHLLIEQVIVGSTN
ncbi:putative reverse transcriptase domain-containing protein [Tanacetum coccineum]